MNAPASTARRGRQARGVVKSAARALEVFEWFMQKQRAATVGEIADGLGYPQSSASMLLQSLVQLGYLEYDRRSRLFQPTIRIVLLGGWVHDKLFAEASVLDLLRELSRRTAETVILAMQNGLHAQYVQIVPGAEGIRMQARPGALRSLCHSACGRVLLSLKPDEEVRRLARAVNATKADPERPVDVEELLRSLAAIRRDGSFMSSGSVTPGAGVIATALPTPSGGAPMAVGVGGPVQRLRKRREEILGVMRELTAPMAAAVRRGHG